MCILIYCRTGERPKPLIARKNLRVAKGLNAFSDYKTNTIAGSAPIFEYFTYYYNVIAKRRISLVPISGVRYWKGEEGLHSNLAIKNIGFGDKVFPAIIPKGSEFYLGRYGDVISNQLKIIRLPKGVTLKQWLDKGPTPLDYEGD